MPKQYNLIAVDDHADQARHALAEAAKRVGKKAGYEIVASVIPTVSAAKKLLETNADIVLFNVTPGWSSNRGMDALNEYRRDNKRTKVILYVEQESPGQCLHGAITASDYLAFINELNISAITVINRTDELARYIMKAIEDIDAVMVSLEDLILNYGEDGYFDIEGTRYSSQQLLRELRMGTPAGNAFRRKEQQTMVEYYMKFGD